MSLQDPERERRKLLQMLRRTGIFVGFWGAALVAVSATRLFANALIDAQFAVQVGIVGGIALIASASLLQTARDLEKMAAAAQTRREPTKQEVRGWLVKWIGAEFLFCIGVGALGFVTFGLVGAIAGSGVAAVGFSPIWIRAFRRIRANGGTQATA